MEQQVWSSCEQFLSTDNRLSRQSLASMRSLIINPQTTNSTISSILETLTHLLQLSGDPLIHHHTLKLLVDLTFYHTHLSPQIFDSVRSNWLHSSKSAHLAVESLAVLNSISERNGNLRNDLDDQLYVALCFGCSVSARLWLLKNAERFGVRPNVLFTVFLGFTKDPYPYVRNVALDGLVGLCKYSVLEDREVIEGCYFRAVELLQDTEDCVRSAAVHVVSEWGERLVATSQQNEKRDWSNVVFVQLCSVVRDMSVGVRVEVFNALGKIQMVSEDILLQTLSKKVLGTMKEKKSHGQYTTASVAAGAFVHGLEDEFCEVRKSACYSMRMLTILSDQYAGQALNLLMDMLNDESMLVRLEALETLHHMATFKHLKLQEMHMHMFLGTLTDNSDLTRSAARKIFKLVVLPNLKLFRLSITGLLENLSLYPQDEADVFSVIFHMGRKHGNFAAHIIKEVSEEIEPVGEGNMGLDSTRVAAFLVLAISVPLSHHQNDQSIPPRLFSYAVTLIGRICCALNDIVDQNAILAYLSRCSRFFSSPGKEVDVHTLISYESRTAVSSLAYQVGKAMNLILEKVKDMWLLVQSGCTKEVLRTLRVFKEELAMYAPASPESVGALAFVVQYLQVMKLFAKVWEHIVWNAQSYEKGELEILLGKLDSRLREMRCRFIGFSKEEELHVLELVLVACILRLCRVEICCYLTAMKKLSVTISRVRFLCNEGSIEPSNFIIEVQKTMHEIGTSIGGTSYSPFLFTKLLDLFSVEQFSLSRRVRYINAELIVPNNNSDPLPFVSGLPVAIPVEIILRNVLGDNRLWLRITMSEESTQFVFLDLKLLGSCDEVNKFTFSAPFYRTPKVASFTLRLCVGMECLFEDVHLVKRQGGPKRVVVYLCPEKEVYLHTRG